MKQKKRCQACKSHKHTLCDGLSLTADGRPCPCCGNATSEDKQHKEKKFKNRNLELDYERYAGYWDSFTRHKKKQLGVDDRGLLGHLPTSEKEEKLLAKESEIPIKWLRRFIEEHREDYCEHKIKVIAFDVYGTILCADDSENAMPPRNGFAGFCFIAKNFGIKIVTSSDAYMTNLCLDLEATFKGRVPFGLEVFDFQFQLDMRPKNYSKILTYYGIADDELMIIGDNESNDFGGAPARSTKVLVPTYRGVTDNFGFYDITIP